MRQSPTATGADGSAPRNPGLPAFRNAEASATRAAASGVAVERALIIVGV